MSYYEPQGWQAPVRQASWEQPPPPSRSGASSTSQRDDGNAFSIQFEEVDRAIDNLIKSGKFYLPGHRRESMPMGSGAGRSSFGEHGGHRTHGGRHSVSEFDPNRSYPASNVQNFYASQRFQGRHNDPEQMMQAKRRLAAQRERELRNYHQEQQYNRSLVAEMASNKSDRSMSPSTMSEEGRRDLIARQHRALYGGEAAAFLPQSGYSDDISNREQPANVPGSAGGAGRGPSPRGMDPFGIPSQSTPMDGTAQGSSTNAQEVSRGEKSGSPTTQTAGGKGPTPPSGEESAHTRHISKSTTAPLPGGMGPIGSRPSTQHAPVQSLSKRTTSPLPASRNFGGFSANDANTERAGSANSNSNPQKETTPNPSMGAWGTGSGVWGSNKIGATSVWG